MDRRRYLRMIGSALVSTLVAGCTGLVPVGGESERPEHPGGTLIIENMDETAVDVSVTVSPGEYDSSFESSVPGGETVIREEFVTAESGDVVTLAARLGDEGNPVEFEFLPAGGDSRNVPPEVARLTFETPVEASATWTAITGR